MRDEDKNFGDSLVLDFRIDDVTSKRSIMSVRVFRYSFLRAIPKIFKLIFSRLSFVEST